MDKFVRQFHVGRLATWHEQHPGSALAVLLDRWVLPGADAGRHGLRLAVRNGYLNLYVKGQSVGQLRLVGSEPQLIVHAKYLAGAECGSKDAASLAQKYEKLGAADLLRTDTATIEAWIRTAETYAGDEKRFVDDLVAVTFGTLDLETGLPADADAIGKDRTAPRMDLVVAQGDEIAMWEAKCATNGELRARAGYRETSQGDYLEGPHVLWQLRRYEKWLRRAERLVEVKGAYVETARLLLQLAQVFGKSGPAISAWEALAQASSSATIVLPPGIVIAEYFPDSSREASVAKRRSYASKAQSFSLHEERLTSHGATVAKIAAKPMHAVLPALANGTIRSSPSRPPELAADGI